MKGGAFEFDESTGPETPIKRITFRKPSEIRAYKPPEGYNLVGDFHIVKGAVTVIGGAPGTGKSRASVALSQAGATKKSWFGLVTHRKFKTMIVQNENGMHRLKLELSDIGPEIDDYVLVSEPPPRGMSFSNSEFREQLAAAISDFKPDVIVIDPWNATTKGQKQEDYTEAFDWIQSVIPKGDDAPAIVIVAHTRKPRADEKHSGRALLNLLAGSYMLGSVPRSVFVLQAATDDTEDKRVVWTCCKNNDGEMGPRSAWIRQNGLFLCEEEFDWEVFDNQGGKRGNAGNLVDRCIREQGLTGLFRQSHLARIMVEKSYVGSLATAKRHIKDEVDTGKLKTNADGYIVLT